VIGIEVGVGVGVIVDVGIGVTVGVGVWVGVFVGAGVGASRIVALNEWMFAHEPAQELCKLFGPSLGTTSERMRSHPHEGKEHLFRLYRESAFTEYV